MLTQNNITGRTRRPSQKPDTPDAAELLPWVHSLLQTLSGLSDAELISESQSLKRALLSGSQVNDPEFLAAGVALADEALYRAHGVRLYDVQLQAVLNLAAGVIVQMQTGEGKTYVAITVACHLALAGHGVHVMTPNEYLAERDSELAEPVFRCLGMSTGLLVQEAPPDRKRAAYDCDVTYGTGHEFGFDYLRDQLALRADADAPIGRRLFHDLCRQRPADRVTMQRGLAFAVVDEADSVLIDDAGSPLVLSGSADGPAPDAAAHRTARLLADVLQEDDHYDLDLSSLQLRLTPEGMNRCYADDVAVPSGCLLRPWTEYVEQALRASLIFRRNIHYVVVDDEVRIVDATTGRIFEDRSWQQGLHQAVEAREGVPITAESDALARITRQRFFRLYEHLSGLTGTAVGCEREFSGVYSRNVRTIPLRVPSARIMLPHRWFANVAARHRAIVESVVEMRRSERPILVGTRSIEDSDRLQQLLEEADVPLQVLNGLQSAEEADIVAQAGERGCITIATNLAGRGTDIHLTDEVRALGGLHVIVAECQLSARMDRQLIGRCGRQGDPGSAQVFLSAEDLLLQRFGGWLAAVLVREADLLGETQGDFTSELRRVQNAAERKEFLGRMELLQQDESRDTLFGRMAEGARSRG